MQATRSSFLYLLFFTISSGILPAPIVEKVDTAEYPKISIHIREDSIQPLENEKITIREKTGGDTESIVKVELLRTNLNRPIHYVFALQASTEEKNFHTKELVYSILKNVSQDDSFALFFYGEDEMFYSENLDLNSFREKLSSLPPGKTNKVFRNTNTLIQKTARKSIPTVLILISPDPISDSLTPDLNLVREAKGKHVKIYSIMYDNTAAVQLSTNTDGKAFSLNDRNIISGLISAFENLKKKPIKLEYVTPFQEKGDSLQASTIEILLKIGEFEFELDYNVSILTKIEGRIQDVEFIFSIFVIILLICILLIYSQGKTKEKFEADYRKKINASKYKADLYYHENNSFHEGNKVAILTTSALEENDDDFPGENRSGVKDISEVSQISPPELPRGKKYETAFLIQKEGPNPGRQFNITAEEVEIGNSAKNDLVLKDNTISQKHSKIKKFNNSFYIFDQGSQRGTFVNGKKVLKPKALSDFDEIRLGRTLLLFRGK